MNIPPPLNSPPGGGGALFFTGDKKMCAPRATFYDIFITFGKLTPLPLENFLDPTLLLTLKYTYSRSISTKIRSTPSNIFRSEKLIPSKNLSYFPSKDNTISLPPSNPWFPVKYSLKKNKREEGFHYLTPQLDTVYHKTHKTYFSQGFAGEEG